MDTQVYHWLRSDERWILPDAFTVRIAVGSELEYFRQHCHSSQDFELFRRFMGTIRDLALHGF